jgi:hypothetical protein
MLFIASHVVIDCTFFNIGIERFKDFNRIRTNGMKISGEFSPKKRKKKKGLDLLKKVYAELYDQLGNDVDDIDLLEAAQLLIDISNDERRVELEDEWRGSSGYYSRDISYIEHAPWLILKNERSNDGLSDERLSYNLDAQQRLKIYMKES